MECYPREGQALTIDCLIPEGIAAGVFLLHKSKREREVPLMRIPVNFCYVSGKKGGDWL